MANPHHMTTALTYAFSLAAVYCREHTCKQDSHAGGVRTTTIPLHAQASGSLPRPVRAT